MIPCMHIHHLNCGLLNAPLMPTMVCHVFLVEAARGLVLVDTGFGTDDYAHPRKRLGAFATVAGLDMDESRAAVRHIERLGFSADDVTDIVLTHMDLDHIGGLSDFGRATIHTTADEHAAATRPNAADRLRYRQSQLDHGPDFRLYGGRGDEWHGLTAHEVDDLPGIALVPMPGHSKGHAAVAVDGGERGWLLHAGDAVFDASAVTDLSPDGRQLKKTVGPRVFERVMGRDAKAIARNHRTLAELAASPDVTVVPAHDIRIFSDLAGR